MIYKILPAFLLSLSKPGREKPRYVFRPRALIQHGAMAGERNVGVLGPVTMVTEWICCLYYLEKSRTPMKTIKQEEPIIRNRFVECPNCKTRNMKIKKVVHVGRCRKCHESYKVVMVYVKPALTSAQPHRPAGSTQRSWETPSDTSLFSKSSETPSTFSSSSFDWSSQPRKTKTESGSGQ